MDISDELLCMFSACITERDDNYVVEIPDREFRLGTLDEAENYRVALLPAASSSGLSGASSNPQREDRHPEPPVEEGDQREVEIEDIGEQGDGITHVDRGYVVIVPDTEVGERVTIEITDVQQNVGFAEVVDRDSHFH